MIIINFENLSNIIWVEEGGWKYLILSVSGRPIMKSDDNLVNIFLVD